MDMTPAPTTAFKRDADLDVLIGLRDSDKGEERERFNTILARNPSRRISIGYYEAQLKEHEGQATE